MRRLAHLFDVVAWSLCLDNGDVVCVVFSNIDAVWDRIDGSIYRRLAMARRVYVARQDRCHSNIFDVWEFYPSDVDIARRLWA